MLSIAHMLRSVTELLSRSCSTPSKFPCSTKSNRAACVRHTLTSGHMDSVTGKGVVHLVRVCYNNTHFHEHLHSSFACCQT